MNKRQDILKGYFDYAATTPIDPRVFEFMRPFLENNKYFANTSSLHELGQKAKDKLEEYRSFFASELAVDRDNIIFTSSATESNNLAIKGIAFARRNKGKHILISSIEHDCIMNATQYLKMKFGFEVEKIKVDKYGKIDLDDLKAKLRDDTILVSIMHANNEIGTLQDLKAIGEILKDHQAYFHTDAAQSFGKIDIKPQELNIDLLTASSHKIYGPKGVALLFVNKKRGVFLDPLLHGGGHEFKLRSSTVNLPAIAGFYKAFEIYTKERDKENKNSIYFRDKIIDWILSNIDGSYLNGHPKDRLPNNVNVRFDFIEGESIILYLSDYGIYASSGSACASNTLHPSHVLLATGLKHEQVHGSLRLSVGRFTTQEDLDMLFDALPKVINKLRKLSPFKK